MSSCSPERAGARRQPDAGSAAAARNPWVRIGAVAALLAGAAAAVYFGGPEWGQVGDAFRAVEWEWIAVAIGLNLLSVLSRLVVVEHDHRPGGAAAASALPPRLLRLLDRLARERDDARAGRGAGAGRRAHAPHAAAEGRLGDARRHGLRAPRVRLRARGVPRRLGARNGRDPALGRDELDHPLLDRRRPARDRVHERAPPPAEPSRRQRPRHPQGRDHGAPRARSHASTRLRPSRRSGSNSSAGSASCSRSGRRWRRSRSTSTSRRPGSCLC